MSSWDGVGKGEQVIAVSGLRGRSRTLESISQVSARLPWRLDNCSHGVITRRTCGGIDTLCTHSPNDSSLVKGIDARYIDGMYVRNLTSVQICQSRFFDYLATLVTLVTG